MLTTQETAGVKMKMPFESQSDQISSVEFGGEPDKLFFAYLVTCQSVHTSLLLFEACMLFPEPFIAFFHLPAYFNYYYYYYVELPS